MRPVTIVSSIKEKSMRQVKQTLLVSAFTVALSTFAVHAAAQTSSQSNSATRAPEMQRGVPGVDVDVGTNAPARRNGVPGVDVDVRTGASNREQRRDANTRASGAGPDTGTAADGRARADRN